MTPPTETEEQVGAATAEVVAAAGVLEVAAGVEAEEVVVEAAVDDEEEEVVEVAASVEEEEVAEVVVAVWLKHHLLQKVDWYWRSASGLACLVNCSEEIPTV